MEKCYIIMETKGCGPLWISLIGFKYCPFGPLGPWGAAEILLPIGTCAFLCEATGAVLLGLKEPVGCFP